MADMIFEMGSRPTNQCHASTIVETTSGLAAAWIGGEYVGCQNAGIWLSQNNGKTWSLPVEVADGLRLSSEPYPCWNPVLFKLKNNILMLFFKVGPSPRKWWGMLMTSSDDGKTWDTRLNSS